LSPRKRFYVERSQPRVSFFFSQKEREGVFQSFRKEDNKEAVFLKTIDNSLLIIAVRC